MKTGIYELLQASVTVLSLLVALAALVASWRTARAQSTEAAVASEHMRISVVPVPIIEDSRLTWHDRRLINLSVRIRNVGTGAMIGVRLPVVRKEGQSCAVIDASDTRIDVLMPGDVMSRQVRFVGSVECRPTGEAFRLEFHYQDVLGNQYVHVLELAVKPGVGAGDATFGKSGLLHRSPN